MRDNRVLLLAPTALDTSEAAEHGTLVPVFESSRDHPPVFSAGFDRAVLARLEQMKYEPDDDLVLIAGPVVALMRLTSTVISRWGRMRALVWDAKCGKYMELSVGELVH